MTEVINAAILNCPYQDIWLRLILTCKIIHKTKEITKSPFNIVVIHPVPDGKSFMLFVWPNYLIISMTYLQLL